MYSVRILRRASEDISKLPKEYARLVGRHIDGLQEDPRPPDAKKLRAGDVYSLRVGVFRILYDVDDATDTVIVYRVKHRREAYR